MKLALTLALFTNLTTGTTHAYHVTGPAPCEEIIQRRDVVLSWDEVFRGAPWVAVCVGRE